MTVATQKRWSLREFVAFDDGRNTRYELVDGALVEMSLGTTKHGGVIRRLAKRIEQVAEQQGTDWIAVQGLVGIETAIDDDESNVRIPDVTVMSEAQWNAMESRSGSATIFQGEPAPIVAIEVLSPSTKSTDLTDKRKEYARRGILEYWLINPKNNTFTVLQLDGISYVELGIYLGDETIVSPIFPSLNLTAAEVLRSGR
jgi:Uma2 family endonuclease